VKELDKLETVLQAAEYEQQGRAAPGALDEFWHSASARIAAPVTRAVLDALRGERGRDG
jgi:5'-deoxynucleotidase YfbR-like HD superfamily hydrolase